MSGRALADLLLRGAVAQWAPRWGGVGLYLQPICGALVLIGLGADGRTGRRISGVATALALVGFAVVSASLGWRPVTAPGWGSLAVLVGLACVVAGHIGRSRARS